METERSSRVAFSPMNVIAGASVLILFATIAWSSLARGEGRQQIFARAPVAADTTTILPIDRIASSTNATSSTPVGDAIASEFTSRFVALSQNGVTASTAGELATDILPSLGTKTHSASDIPTDPDTSLSRVLHYRDDMRTALAPLLNNTTPELDIYAQWIQTGDDSYLATLGSIAKDYDAAIANAEKVRVPADAVQYQIGVLDAMTQFAAALRALANNAKDPVASITLLRTYNAAEKQMFTAFNSLALYSAQKAQ
jgi:hypothetical protein